MTGIFFTRVDSLFQRNNLSNTPSPDRRECAGTRDTKEVTGPEGTTEPAREWVSSGIIPVHEAPNAHSLWKLLQFLIEDALNNYVSSGVIT